MYSNCCCSCSFEPEIIKIDQSSHKMHRNKILNFQEFTTILNTCTKKVWKVIELTTYIYIYIYIYEESLETYSMHLVHCDIAVRFRALTDVKILLIKMMIDR